MDEATIPNPSFDESEEYHDARKDTEIQKDSENDLDKDQTSGGSRKGLVKNGICIQCGGKKWYFDYEISTKSADLDDSQINSWEVISTTEKSGCTHFRCLWLSDPNGLSLIQSVTETCATVVIVINSIESFQVEDWVYDICSLPVVVLCSSAGHILRRIFDKTLDPEVVAMISLSPIEVEENVICKTDPDEDRQQGFNDQDQTSKKNSKSLSSRVFRYLSESQTSVPIKVSDDPTVFAMIMSEFRVYEVHKQGRDANEIKKVLDLLNKRIHQVFDRDFPFYFCIAGRMMCAKSVYSDVHFEKFCTMCTEKFEQLECKVVATTLVNFISRPDRDLVAEGENFLTFLETAIKKLGKRQLRNSTTTRIYPVMLWISVLLSVKLVLKKQVNPEAKWSDSLERMSHVCEVNTADVIRGQHLGKLLELPADSHFSYKNLLQLMTPLVHNKSVHVPTFHEQKNALDALPDNLSEEEFIDYVGGIINYYAGLDTWKPDSPMIKQITGQSTNSAAIVEGISLMDCYHSFLTTKGWDHTKFKLQSWLCQLCKFINFKNKPQNCIHALFSSNSEVVKIHRKSLILFATGLTEQKLKSMTIDQFNSILECCDIWERKLVAVFLQEFTVQSHPKLKELKDCQLLLKTLIERPRLLPDYNYIWKFLKGFADTVYTKTPANFILDLLKLQIPELPNSSENTLSETDLEAKLRNYIKDDERIPKRLLILLADGHLKSINEERNGVHMIILSAIRKETVTLSKRSLVLKAIESMALLLTESIAWAEKAPNQRELFCLDFITSYLDTIKVATENFEWICRCKNNAMISILNIYGNFLEKSKYQPTMKEIPESVQDNESQSAKNLFEWILKIKAFLDTWRDRFSEHTVNYDQINAYIVQLTVLQNMSHCMKVEHLVCSEQELKELKQEYERKFKDLNSLLLKPIPGDGQRKTCSVSSALQKFNLQFPESIKKKLNAHVRLPSDQRPHNWRPVRKPLLAREEQCVQLSPDLLLSDLSKLVCDLTSFLHPLMSYLDILAFFHERPKAMMFNTYLRNFAKSERDKVENRLKDEICDEYNYLGAFFNALQQTISLVEKIISGKATYGESVIDHELNLNTLDVDSEFTALSECPNLATDHDTGHAGLKCTLKLMQFETQYYDSIVDVCKQYDLDRFCDDKQLLRVQLIISEVRNKEKFHQLTANVAQEKWQCLEDILKIRDKNMECFKLFAKMADCIDFYHFLKERKFVGPNCAEVFRSQLRLISQQIECDITDHDMMVMDHLYSSVSFMAPFLDQTQTFEMLMTSVSELDATTGLSQLDTVRSNMHLIHVWFSKAQDNLENVAVELECIWRNGRYCFDIAHETLLLKFEQSQVLVVSASYSGSNLTAKVIWKEEQVKDFIHKLGFLEHNEEQRQRRDTFMAVTDTANKLLKVFIDLRDKGHPDYFMASSNAVDNLACSCDILQLNEKVIRVQKILNDWNRTVQTLHAEYKWLLFFRIPKLMQLCKYLPSESTIVDSNSIYGIYQEVQFLLQRTGESYLEKQIVKDIKEAFAHAHQESASSAHYKIELIGSILRILFTEKGYSIRNPMAARRQLESAATSVSASIEVDTLFSTSECSHSELVYLVLNIYKGPPEPFEFLRCCPTTTEEELRIFMKRILEHPRMYIILYVNCLPHFLQEVLLQEYLEFRQRVIYTDSVTKVHFVETAPSVLREIPWLKLVSIDHEDQQMTLISNRDIPYVVKKNPSLKSVELVYGLPGDGKTHYIREKLLECRDNSCRCTIVINETFTLKSVIERLQKLPRKDCSVHFNITSLLTNVTKEGSISDKIGWFFFDLLLLGYVEDPPTGLSFSFSFGTSWNLYIEIPCRQAGMSSKENLEKFKNEFPVVAFIGIPKLLDSTQPFKVDNGVQLVCKYLKRFDTNKIDVTLPSMGRQKIKFSLDDNLSDKECRKLLDKYMEKHSIKKTKTDQKLFVSYMKRRCNFLDNLPAFNFNYGRGYCRDDKGKRKDTDLTKLGSTLMSSMLKEVEHFCDPRLIDDWTRDPHQQLIYDIDPDGGGAIGLISLHPEQISQADRAKFFALGVKIPSMKELYERSTLDKWLSQALGLKITEFERIKQSRDDEGLEKAKKRKKDTGDKSEKGKIVDEPKIRIKAIDDMKYVLTLDYALKMINIHERRECGIPVIIEGETGVGKTALIEMLSQLWNHAWLSQWETQKSKMLLDDVEKKLGAITPEEVESFQEVCDAIHNIRNHKIVSKEQMLLIATLPHKKDQFYCHLMKSLLDFKNDPIFSMLDVDLSKLKEAYSAMEKNNSPEDTAEVMSLIFNAKVKSVFYKLNIHAALQPLEIYEFFSCVCSHANDLNCAYSKAAKGNLRVPLITVYLDEINTSSFLGILKEIITDRTIEGEPIPDNIFIIAACNPLRADSLAIYRETVSETWLKAAYYVQRLHPSLRQLIWDYGALNRAQEKQYITAKMDLLNTTLSPSECDSLNSLIVESQEKMREYALDHIRKLGHLDRHEAELCSRSCVSQRDIQRVFTFYTWLIQLYKKYNPHKESEKLFHRRAVMVALGLVYYMRLNSNYRESYRNLLDSCDKLLNEVTFSEAYEAAIQWFTAQLELPSGIAKTIALKENVCAIAVCTMTRIPLIIVGDPGTSKTISFNIVTANLKGKESKIKLFRNTEIFKSLDAHFYQCSKRTTSVEIEKVFTRAINRQHYLAKVPLPVLSVVLMDEAGLPESDMESLKALHYYLDEQEVSFVAISNHVLDAAKTNRAVSLFRPRASCEELRELALVSIGNDKNDSRENYSLLIEALVKAYDEISGDKKHDQVQNAFRDIFGLRDFIFLVTHLRRKISDRKFSLSPQLIVQGLERNFNGTDRFMELCEVFLKYCYEGKTIEASFRSILSVMKESLGDSSMKETSSIHSSVQSEVRHMMIIDCSEDSSVIRLVFQRGILPYQHLRFYVCGDFPGDVHGGGSDMRINTISQIRHSVAAGHTVLMCQTEEIHECFYDLFNQRYNVINDPRSNRRHYYTNIAIGAHSKPCKVDPKFRCIVVVKKEDLPRTPLPFLNRFEKYHLSHDVIYKMVLDSIPLNAQLLIKAVHQKVKEFAENSNFSDYLYGYRSEDTLKSLMLTILPSEDGYKPYPMDKSTQPDETECHLPVNCFLLKRIAHAMHLSAGFNIKLYDSTSEELAFDARHLFQLSKKDTEYVHLNQLKHQQVAGLVDEALNVLFYRRQEDESISVYIDTCMVISLVFHWLVMMLCKRLMQLMIAEALPTIQDCIPTYYIEHYLSFQNHFSLKNLVSTYLRDIEQSKGAIGVQTKLMCFTRSSPLIRQLPTEFPTHDSSLCQTQKDFLQQYLCDDIESLVLCKLSSRHSQANLEDMIKSFTMSSHKVLMFIVDSGINFYQQSSRESRRFKENVSHLRMMIEEAEVHSSSNGTVNTKVFVVLIHFPPARLLTKEPCYPALFLQGWDHFYLDTIADGALTRSGTMASVVNVEQWLYSCLIKPTDKSVNLRCDKMEQNVEDILRDAIPSVASRLTLRSRESDYKTFLDVSSKTAALKHILLGREGTVSPESTVEQSYTALEKGVGVLLARCFSKYWNSREMNRYLQKFTSLTFIRKSTLNLTASVETTFRSLFCDFLVYRLSRMEVSFDLYMLLDNDITPSLIKCLLHFLEHLPLPRLEQLSQLSDLPIVDLCSRPKHIPKFPFLSVILKSVNKIIDESDDEVKLEFCKHLAPGVEMSDGSISQMTTNERIEKCSIIVKAKVSKLLEDYEESPSLIGQFLYLLKDLPELWEYYFHEVVTVKVDPQGTLGRNVFLIKYIGPFQSLTQDCVDQFVAFHVHLCIHHLDILRVERALKPITIFTGSERGDNFEGEETLSTMLDVEHISDLSAHIVNKLYDFACNLICTQMNDWLICFRKILSIQSFVEDVFRSQLESIHRKFSLMHTTHLIASAGDSEELHKVAHHFFLRTKNSNFSMNNKLDIMSKEAINDIEEANLDHLDTSSYKQTFMEGFILFNFSESRVPYPEADCEWFYELSNKQSCFVEGEATEFWSKCAQFGVFHLILTRILGFSKRSSSKTEDQTKQAGILNNFDERKRARVGEVLLCGKKFEEVPPFIPHMYSKLDESLTSPNFLAELYFSIALNHLKQRNYLERHLIQLTKKLSESVSSSSTDEERYLCLIEKEAVVHALLECVSSHLDPKHPNEARELINRRLHNEINSIISDEPKVMIEGMTEVPACLFTLAYNLQCRAKSSEWLMKQLQDDESAVIQVLPTIKPLHLFLQPRSSEDILSRMLLGREMSGTVLGKLYDNLKTALEDIHNKHKTKSEQKLISIIEDYYKKCADDHVTCGVIRLNKFCALQMVLWNCIYYNFYEQERSSQAISDSLAKLSPKYLEDCVLMLFQSFVCPQNMYQRLESTFSGHADEARYRLTSSLHFEPIRPEGEVRDPLFEFFSPKHTSRWKKDPLEISLKQSLGNLVAATLAIGRLGHLWYHMFESNELLDTHMTGYMYDHKVTSAHKYDCGVELSQGGLYGRPDYKLRAEKNLLSLHSWYLILWANFGAFCIGLITQPNAHEKIGKVLSDHHSDIRHICVAQMRNFWLHMNLTYTIEETFLFIQRAMTLHVKTCTTKQGSGKFLTLESVSSYEEVWHNDVYTPSHKEVQRFIAHSTSEANQLEQKLRQIKLYSPCFPSEMEFMQALQQSSDNIESRQILCKFIIEYTRLKVGAKLLPNLIKLYNWIHRELKCLVDEKYAQDNGLEEIITKGDKLFPKLDLCGLYKKVTDDYNEYIDCIGHHIGAGACANVKREGVIFHLTHETKLVHMLSVDRVPSSTDDDDEVSTNGWLLLVILDIIQHHNGFLNDIHNILRSDKRHSQFYSIVDEDFKVQPEEVEESDCIVGHSDRLLQLIRCHHLLSSESRSHSEYVQMLAFDYEKLEKDVIEEFILGKPMINDDIKSLRIPFKYRKSTAVAVGVGISEADVDALSGFLGEEFKIELSERHKKELECQLHAADHNKLNEIAAGLLVSANHLVKSLHPPDGPVNSLPGSLKDLSLRQFLIQLYKKSSDTPDTILLENIGIKNLTATEKVCLINLGLRNLFATLKLLVQWIHIGVYDFCHLPLALKKQINDSDELIERIHSTFTGTVGSDQLLREVEDMSKALIQCEMELQKDNRHCQEPLIPYIRELSLVHENDLLPKIIPDTVLGANYVSLHLLLRRVTDDYKRKEIHHNRWDDFTPELWAEGNLKYLRDVALPFDQGEFVYDPAEDCFEFQKPTYQPSIMQEEGFVFCADEEFGIEDITKQPDKKDDTAPHLIALSEETTSLEQPKKDPKDVASTLTKEDIGNFLHGIKLDQYIELFFENDVDGQMLIVLTEVELKDIGIANTFHQKKIIQKFGSYLMERC